MSKQLPVIHKIYPWGLFYNQAVLLAKECGGRLPDFDEARDMNILSRCWLDNAPNSPRFVHRYDEPVDWDSKWPMVVIKDPELDDIQEYYVHETKCRRCSELNNVVHCKVEEFEDLEVSFRKWLEDLINEPTLSHCKGCKCQTVQDTTLAIRTTFAKFDKLAINKRT